MPVTVWIPRQELWFPPQCRETAQVSYACNCSKVRWAQLRGTFPKWAKRCANLCRIARAITPIRDTRVTYPRLASIRIQAISDAWETARGSAARLADLARTGADSAA